MGYEYPDGQSVDFYGIEVLNYYLKQFLVFFSDYPIQIQILYAVILICIATSAVVFILFMVKVQRNLRKQRQYNKANKELREGFYMVLVSEDPPTVEYLELACDKSIDKIKTYSPRILSQIISELCMDLSVELNYIPNADPLCTLTGVKTFYERNLLNSHDVLYTLQNLVNMHIRVSEGLLAIYINHHNTNIRHLSRICHIISTETEPYRYLVQDLSEKQSLWRPMALHRLFGWLKANEKQMPQFLVLAEGLEHDETSAFLIEEVAYWGSNKEKDSLHELFLSPRYNIRIAALRAVTILRDEKQEQYAIDSYDEQPENIRREVLKAVRSINSGRHTDFFLQAYRYSSSKATREVALTCLYSYGEEGRRTFELLRQELIELQQSYTLLDQVDAQNVINQMRLI